jgi:hypothetical protein
MTSKKHASLFGGRLYIYSVPGEKERKRIMGKDRGKETLRILIRDHLYTFLSNQHYTSFCVHQVALLAW